MEVYIGQGWPTLNSWEKGGGEEDRAGTYHRKKTPRGNHNINNDS